MLSTERLYYKQKRLAAPDMRRWAMVKRTMARVKVVLGERQRAFSALHRVRRDADHYPSQLQPEADPEAPSLIKPTDAPHAWKGQGRTGVGSRLVGEIVTIKRFGRKMKIPSDHPWALRPTRSEINTAMRRGKWAGDRAADKAAAHAKLAKGLAALPDEIRDLVDDEGRLIESRMRLAEEDAMEAATQSKDKRFDGGDRGGSDEGRQ